MIGPCQPPQDFAFACRVTKIDYAEWGLIQILFPKLYCNVLSNICMLASRISNILLKSVIVNIIFDHFQYSSAFILFDILSIWWPCDKIVASLWTIQAKEKA